jgi:PAS domain S-box-containing protein
VDNDAVQFDSRLALSAFGVMWLAFALFSTAVWLKRRKYPGFGRWAAAGPALLLSLFLLSLRPSAPDWLSMIVANTVLAAAAILYLEGAREFRGLAPVRRLVYAVAGFTLGTLVFFLYVVPSLNTRAALMSAFLVLTTSMTAVTLMRAMPPAQKLGLRLTGSMFALCAATNVVRAIYCALAAPIGDLFDFTGTSGVFALVISAETALLPMGVMFLRDERVIADLEDARERAWRADAEVARRRDAEALARASEQRFRTMADAAPVMIWVSDVDKACTYVNRLWLEFTGRSMEAELGTGWADGVHPDDVADCLDVYNQAFDRREAFRMEYRVRRHDGAYRWILDSGAPIAGVDGTFAGYVGSAIDVTDHRLAREALSELSGKLMEAQETERTWIARELHDDLAQRAAGLAMQLFSVAQGLPRGTAEHLRVRESSDHAANLARDIQSISHRLHSATLESLGLESAAAGLCRELAEQHEVAIDFSHDGDSENLPKDVVQCLFRVLQEALSNAVRHAGVPHVSVSLRRTPATIELQVSDRGVGFDSTAMSARDGLGLISMKERLHLVKGEIHVESQRGAGTTVRARVPIASFGQSASERDAQVQA